MSGNVPAIRFAGFTEPWEQRKLGELVDGIATGKSVNSDDGVVGPGDVGIMKTSCVSYDTFDAGESKRVLPEEQSLVACPVEAKTIIVSRMNTPDRVGACGFVADNWPNLFLPDRLWRVRLRNSVDPYLVYVLLASDRSKEVLRGMASGTSGSMHNIPKGSFLGMELTLPTSLEEQSKIAKQFASLDSLITLHQRKDDQLATLKKSLLEKMFPKPGSDVPELRFAGFTEPWEQRKLGELFVESDDRSSELEILSVSVANGIYPASQSGRDTNPGASLSNYKVVRPGDVVYNSMRMWQGAVDSSLYEGIVSPAYVVARPTEDVIPRFFARLLRRPELLVQYQRASQGNSKDTQVLKFEEFANIVVHVPHDGAEQIVIGEMFDELDNLITLHQRKHDQLATLKKSLLEKMFV
jgi:type I restriction enzyme S subunit